MADPTEREAAVVDVDGMHVRVLVGAHADGVPYVRLAGSDCDLEGDEPGLYTPVSHASIAERILDDGVCPRCGSDDVSAWAAPAPERDITDFVGCNSCKFEGRVS
ncbi:MAG TPA: hypothetical protein VGJ32_09140 [Solirubrobacteraceae bacterium]|jgi:hypothetical protein